MQTIERPVGDERLPFTLRLLSFDNLLAPPIDHYCPTVSNAVVEGPDGRSSVQICVGNTSPGVDFSVGDRFNGHKVGKINLM